MVNYVSPVSGTWAAKSSSPFKARRSAGRRYHSGDDLQAKNGSKAVASIGGRVLYAGHNQGYQWNAVVLGDDGNGYRYATHGPLDVKVGQRVEQGQPVGAIARSHLHFEIIPAGSSTLAQMVANPGAFVSTSWKPGNDPATIDPAAFFGVEIGQEVAAGKAVGDASQSQVIAQTPSDPFGVSEFQEQRDDPAFQAAQALNTPDDYISGSTLGPETDPTPRPRVAADDMSGAPQRVMAGGVPMPLLRDGLSPFVPDYNRPTTSAYYRPYESPAAQVPFDAVINDTPQIANLATPAQFSDIDAATLTDGAAVLLGSAGNDTVPMPRLREDHLPPSITGGPYDISPSPEELTAANYRTNPNRAPMFTPEEAAALSGFQSPEDVVPMTSPRRMPMFDEEDRAMLSGFQTPEDVVPRTSPRRVPMMSEAERAQLSGFQSPEDVVPRSRDSVRPIPTPRESPRRQVAEQPMPGPFLPRPEFPGSLPAAESLPMVATPPDRPIGSLPAAPFEPGEWADPMMGPFDHLGMTADRIQWDQDQAARRRAFEEERSVQAPMTVPIVGDPTTTGNSLVPFINAMPQRADAGGLNDRFNNTFDAVGYTPQPSIDRFNDTFAAVGYEPPLSMPDMPADPLMAGNSTVPFSGPVPQPVPMGVAPPMRGIEREARPDALSMPFTAPGRPETMTDFGMPSLFGSMPGLPADGLMMADAGAAVRQVYPDMASTPLPAPAPMPPAPVQPLPPPVTIDTAPIDNFAWTQEPTAMRAPDYRESFSPTLTGEFGGTQPTQAAGGMPAPQPVPDLNQPIDITPRSQASINAQQAPSSVPQPQAQADNQQWLRGIVDKHVDSLFGGGIGTMMRNPFGGLFTGSSNPSQTGGNNYAPTGTSSYTNNSGERQSYSHGSYNGQRAVQTPGGTVFAENRDGTYSQVL